MNKFFAFAIKPFGIVIITTAFSLIMWFFPSFDGSLRKGFVQSYPVSYIGIVNCVVWLILIILLAYIGFYVGNRLKLNTDILDKRASINSLRPYLLISIFSYIGIASVFARLLSELGFSGIIGAITGGQANALKETLYDSYSIGIVSLRYMAIPACALAMYNLTQKRFILLDIVNILGLITVAIISSRLSIIFTIFTFLPLLIYKSKVKITFSQFLLTITVLFHLLAALNYSRNINFYRYIGIDNFYAAGFSEILTYVGSPFQGFLAAGTLGDRFIGTSELDASAMTGISFELSTNSAFLELVRRFGVVQSFLMASLYVLFGSLIIGIAIRNKNNVLILLFGTIGYCFAELWRVFLFGQGIVYTIVLLVIFITIWCVYFPTISLLKSKRMVRQDA